MDWPVTIFGLKPFEAAGSVIIAINQFVTSVEFMIDRRTIFNYD